MRNVLDSFCRNFGNAPSELNAGVYRHDDQAARAQPYLRALLKNGGTAGSDGFRRSKGAGDAAPQGSPSSSR
ncbi:hypothetical protein ACC705_02820 [Rhizobium ruizarguesonis]